MKMRFVLVCGLILSVVTSKAQTAFEEISADPNKSASVYYAYPEISEQYTLPPEGYTPFIFLIMGGMDLAILFLILNTKQ